MPALQIIALDTATPRLRAPGTGDTYAAPRAVDIAPETLTGSSAASSLSIAQTWNTTGAPNALDIAITDTASNAASNLIRARVGGVTRFSVQKDGAVNFATTGGTISIGAAAGLDVGTFNILRINEARFGPSSDAILARSAANTLAVRNSTNAQTFLVNGTFTDASNHRRVSIGMTTAGVGHIRPEGAGTGASGNVLHISGLPTSNPGPGILWNNAGNVAIGT